MPREQYIQPKEDKVERPEFEIEKFLGLKEKYLTQIKGMNELGIIELLPDSGEMGVIDINGVERPIPTYEEVLARVESKSEQVMERYEQGFTEFVLTPIGMPIKDVIWVLQNEMRKQPTVYKPVLGDLKWQFLSLELLNEDHDDWNVSAVYGGGLVKKELVASQAEDAGWGVGFLQEDLDWSLRQFPEPAATFFDLSKKLNRVLTVLAENNDGLDFGTFEDFMTSRLVRIRNEGWDQVFGDQTKLQLPGSVFTVEDENLVLTGPIEIRYRKEFATFAADAVGDYGEEHEKWLMIYRV